MKEGAGPVDRGGDDRMRRIAGTDRRTVSYLRMHTLVALHGQPGWVAADARAGFSLTAEPLSLVAVTASSTVQLTFTAHPVPQERVTATLPLDQ